jgi:hypothetical protein
MDRLTIWMLPTEIRTSHGDEIDEMLALSARPIRDGADVAIAGAGLRLGRATRPLLVTAMIAMFVFLLGLVHAIQNLQHGVVEIPDHWWSTFTAAGLVGSIFAAVVLRLAHRNALAWNTLSS